MIKEDMRFQNCTLLDRRKQEWNLPNVEQTIKKIFDIIVREVKNFKVVKYEWVENTKHSRELKFDKIKILKVSVNISKNEEVSKIISYDFNIPLLVNKQFFFLGGNHKVPLFHLFYHHIMWRKNILKFRNNLLSINFDTVRNDKYVIGIFNKQIKLPLLLSILHDKKTLQSFDSTQVKKNDLYTKIFNESIMYIDKYTIAQRKDLIVQQLSNNISTSHNHKSRLENILYAIGLAYELDFFSVKFMNQKCILLEMLEAINSNMTSDTDVMRKRIRFSEYLFVDLLQSIYKSLIDRKSAVGKKAKFNIPGTAIYKAANISEIVRFHYPNNPIAEIATLFQCTITGTGSLSKKNVPPHLRDLDESQKGLLCPADTPDRDGCGVTLNLIPTVEIDVDGKFIKPENLENICSYSINMSPFVANNDPTREQMASNHSKQSILLKNSKPALVRTGLEGKFLDHGNFLHKAKYAGKVIFTDASCMIVFYEDIEDVEVLDIGLRDLSQQTLDVIHPLFEVGEFFKQGAVLAKSSFIKGDQVSIGQNLLTAVGIWKGYNYEDGIVISKSVKNKFTSLHYIDLSFTIYTSQFLLSLKPDKYQPLPIVGDFLKKGEVYAKSKICDLTQIEQINKDPLELKSPMNCRIAQVELYANSWNKRITDHNNFINTSNQLTIEKQTIIENVLCETIGDEKTKKVLQRNHIFSSKDTNKFYQKGTEINGVYVKIQAVYEEQIGVGDKLSGRHGNKGIIAQIEEDDNMPVTEDGRRIDIIINPLGIISRMNIGQLYELHVTCALQKFTQNISGVSRKEALSQIRTFLKIIDFSDNHWTTNKIISDMQKYKTTDEILERLYLIQPPFQSCSPEALDELMKYSGAAYRQQLTCKEFEISNPLTVGYMYMLKLTHRALKKQNARSIGPYSSKTLQPINTSKSKGSNRLGEMEASALLSHGANDLLKDFMTIQSDAIGLKNKFLAKLVNNPHSSVEDFEIDKPNSLMLFDVYLKMLGFLAIDESPTE